MTTKTPTITSSQKKQFSTLRVCVILFEKDTPAALEKKLCERASQMAVDLRIGRVPFGIVSERLPLPATERQLRLAVKHIISRKPDVWMALA